LGAGPGTASLPTPGAPAPTVPGGTDTSLQSLVDFLMGGFSNQAAGQQP
jgi:hypothetical protein